MYERFQDGIRQFTHGEYVVASGLDSWDATHDIQAYLDEQRRVPRASGRGGSRAQYVLHRKPGTRTRNAVWVVGVSAADARGVGRSFANDVSRRVMRAFEPDLRHIAARNPRAARQVEAQIRLVTANAIAILEQAAQGMVVADDEEE